MSTSTTIILPVVSRSVFKTSVWFCLFPFNLLKAWTQKSSLHVSETSKLVCKSLAQVLNCLLKSPQLVYPICIFQSGLSKYTALVFWSRFLTVHCFVYEAMWMALTFIHSSGKQQFIFVVMVMIVESNDIVVVLLNFNWGFF